jgi:hypothetical protein
MSRRELVHNVRELIKHFDIKHGDWPGIHGRTYSGDRVWCLVDTELAHLLFKLQSMVTFEDNFATDDLPFSEEEELIP